MKRCRLKIPSMISKEDSYFVSIYKHRDGKELRGDEVDHIKNIGYQAFLEEIKDEPMSAEEIVEEFKRKCRVGNSPSLLYAFSTGQLVELVKLGAAENEKKHRMQQTFDGWFDSCGHDHNYVLRKEGWQAHAKATNTEA